MRTLGNKVAARNLAISIGVPVMPATEPLPDDADAIKAAAAKIGYPVMLKASWGGGGRGMRPIETESELIDSVVSAKREAKAAFGKDEVYLEKLVRRARHVEVQILGDQHGNRRASVRARLLDPAPQPEGRRARAGALPRRGDAPSPLRLRAQDRQTPPTMCGAGTVEFLMDADTGKFYFIEVNPRIQVEHTVTEVVTGIDIVKAQIRIAEGGRIGNLAGDRRADAGSISASTATLCSAGSPPRTPRTISSPTTAASPPIAARPALASGSMAAPPIPARSSRASTTRCWRRSPPGRRPRKKPSAACTGLCASSASAAWRPTSPSSRLSSRIRSFAPMKLHDPLHRRDARAVPIGQAR